MEALWSYADLQARYGVGPRQIRRVVAALGIKPLTLGHRTVRFRPAAVLAAEERAEGKGKKTEERGRGGEEEDFVLKRWSGRRGRRS
jgi:hypothetical protein